MCTELININYSTFKSLHTRCRFQTCLIEEDKLAFAGAPNGGYKEKEKSPHKENCYKHFFHLIPSNQMYQPLQAGDVSEILLWG